MFFSRLKTFSNRLYPILRIGGFSICSAIIFLSNIAIGQAEAQTADGFVQQARLNASDGVRSSVDNLGYSVVVDGNTAVAGVPGDDKLGLNTGAVYVFSNDGGSWTKITELRASDGAEGDSFGYSVSVSGNTIVVGAPYRDEKGDDSGAAYVFSNDGGTWNQTEKLSADDGNWGDHFGHSVSVSGNTIVVGVPYQDENDDDSGAAYVFSNDGGTWNQTQQKLIADDDTGNVNDHFGHSVSVSGNTIVVGSPDDHPPPMFKHSGSAYVFSNDGGIWTQTEKLTSDDGDYGDQFGSSVSVSGNTIVVGARHRDEKDHDSGSAYVFSNDGGTWTQTEKLTLDDGANGDQFGYSVSVFDNTIVVSAPWKWNDALENNSGLAYVFSNDGGTWTQAKKLTPDDTGNWDDRFGYSVSISDNTIVVGAPKSDQDHGTDDSGAGYVFTRPSTGWAAAETHTDKWTVPQSVDGGQFGRFVSVDGTTIVVSGIEQSDGWGTVYVFSNESGTWIETAMLRAESPWGDFGHSVSVSDNTIVVGAHWKWNEDLENDSGAVYVFSNESGTWTQAAKLTISDGDWGDQFGRSVSVSGNTIAVGVSGRWNDILGTDSGAVYVFSNESGTWNLTGRLMPDDGADDDNFGSSVSVSGNTIAVGAMNKEENKGAVYVFSNESGTWTQAAKLTISDGISGDHFGRSVSVDGSTIVGVQYERGDGWSAAYVFSNESGTWMETGRLMPDDGNWGAFGTSVSISGSTIVVGAEWKWNEELETGSGAAYVFSNESGTWMQTEKLTPDDGANGDQFGRSVSISGSTVVVGAWNKDEFEGAAYVYQGPEPTLLQRADADGSGDIGVPDFLAFVDAFGTDNPRFDFNGDGKVNIPDFLIFVNDLFGKPVT